MSQVFLKRFSGNVAAILLASRGRRNKLTKREISNKLGAACKQLPLTPKYRKSGGG
jgi:hypothetical protein